MTNAACLANRLATIHKDMCALSQAVSGAAGDVEAGRATIAASIERRLTDDLETVAFRLERMANAESIGVLGFKVYDAAITIAAAFLHQRYHCRRNRAQFIAHGAAMSALTESGVYQVLIAKRKEAKAQAQAEEVQTVETVEVETEQAPTVEAVAVEPSDIVVSFRGLTNTHTATHTTIENNLLMVWNGLDFVMAYPVDLAHVVKAPWSDLESAEPLTLADPLTSAESEPVERLGTFEREAVCPETGYTYKITEDGHVMSRAKGGQLFYSLPFTLPLLAIVRGLGLVE